MAIKASRSPLAARDANSSRPLAESLFSVPKASTLPVCCCPFLIKWNSAQPGSVLSLSYTARTL